MVDTTHPENPLLTDEAAQAGKPTLKDDVVATCEKLGFEVGAAAQRRSVNSNLIQAASTSRTGCVACASCLRLAGRAGWVGCSEGLGQTGHRISTVPGCRLSGPLQKLKILSVEPGKDESEGFVTFQVGAAGMEIVGMGVCRAVWRAAI